MSINPITWARRHFSVPVKLYALGIPLAVLSGALVLASVLPYRATEDRLTRAREDIAVVMASRRVEQNTNETMWHTLRLVLTGDPNAARSLDHSQRASSEALTEWLSSEHDPQTKQKLTEMGRLKQILDTAADRVIATVDSGDLLAARDQFYDDVYPAFDEGFDEDFDELLKRQEVQLREGFTGLAGATGPAEFLLGEKLAAHIGEASQHVADAEVAADFIAELTDSSVEMVELALDGDPDLDDAADLRLEVERVLASWEQTVSDPGATHGPVVRRIVDGFEELGRTEDLVLARSTDNDLDGAVELLAGPYASQLQVLVSDAERFIAHEEADIAALTDGIAGDARTSNSVMLIGAIALFVIGGTFVVRLARSLARRLRTLTAAANQMGSGDLSVRVEIDTPDELGELGRTFNTMGEALSDAHDRLASLFGRTVEAGERERTQLAADLHDGPVQRFTAIGYVVERVSQLVARGAVVDADRVLDVLKQSISTEVGGLRRMMSELRPPALDTRGLAAAVDDYGTQFGLHHEIDVTIEVCSDRLAPALETTIYRVMQESLTNVAKHAGASAVSVKVTRKGDDVVLSVSDDGVGFDTSVRVVSTDHFGLDGMEQRVKIAAGRWSVASTPGEGTTVTARFPVAKGSQQDTPAESSSPNEYGPVLAGDR